MRGSGKILLFAHTHRQTPHNSHLLPLDPSIVCALEKDLLGSYSSDFTLQDEVARLIFTRKLDIRPSSPTNFPCPDRRRRRPCQRPVRQFLKSHCQPTTSI